MNKNKSFIYASLLGLTPPYMIKEFFPHIPEKDHKTKELQIYLIKKAEIKRKRRLDRNIKVQEKLCQKK